MRKRHSFHGVAILISLMLLLLYSPKAQALTEEEEILKSMKLVTENEYLELYIDEKETDVAVRVKASGDIWFTNPVKAEEDSIATPFNQKLMKSQFSIRYFNENVQASEMDNYNDSIAKEQFEIEYHQDGMTITYVLGEMASKIILPNVISEERFLQFYNQMDEKAQKQVKRNYNYLNYEEMTDKEKDTYLDTYPIIKERNIYTLKTSVKDYKKEELMEYFVAVGYTAEDMEFDALENGYESADTKPYFSIPLTYKLEGDNLIVSITPKDIEYNTEGYYLVDIDLMEYFGAASIEEEGYLFVPDGSGALIYFNNGKTAPSYFGQVYGQDRSSSFLNNYRADISENLTIKLPVYGIKKEGKALLAIIEDGDALADISADVSGRTNSYNYVYAGFNYLQNGPISLDNMIGNYSFQMYSKEPYNGEFKIRYGFLSGDKANYSGMANYYRDYLIDNGQLSRGDVSKGLPFYVEYIGAIDKTKSFLGIKYQAIESLTTYKQAAMITENLISNGIDNIKIKYSGWMNGGLGSTAPTKVNPVSKLHKGGLDLKKYIKEMSSKAIPVYFDVNFQYVYEDTLFDGFTVNKYSPRYFDNTVIRTGRYLIPNGLIPTKNIGLISPYFVNSIADKFIKGAEKYQLPGISVGKMATHLFSDFQSSRYTNRQQAIKYYDQALAKLSNHYDNKIIGSNASAYTFNYLTDILEAPMDSNGYYIFDETVPFYQMVIRGYIDFAGKPMNLADDYTEEFLKSIETGAGLYFTWIYEDNSALKETDYDDRYSVHYGNWLDRAVDSYHKMNHIFADLQGQTIVNHEQVQNKVYQVTYEDGTQILVNYNNFDVTYDNCTVYPKDFAVVKEGR